MSDTPALCEAPLLLERLEGAALVVPALLLHIMALALICGAHIGADRLFGYGLKYDAGFGFTHLGTIGRSTD